MEEVADRKRKRPDSLTSDDSFEKSNGSCFDPSDGSQIGAAKLTESHILQTKTSTSPSLISLKNESMYHPMSFCGEVKARQEIEGPKSSECDDTLVKIARNQEVDKDQEGENQILERKKILKKVMRDQFTMTHEGLGNQQSSLNSIYTKLSIITGGSGGPHPEHVVRHVKPKLERRSSEQLVKLSEIFKALPGQRKENRTVLTKGVAGIGKSFSVHKFILDWAEERANQHIDFILCLPFKELNLSKEDKSLHELLREFHPVLHDLGDSEDLMKARVIVILDGLDESRFELDFNNNKPITSVSEETSVANLITNLIQGNLLPEAKLWITSRPAAADQIPAKFIHLVTEIRGFTDPQKEKYFRRRFSHDLDLADRIISHIRSSHNLDIMCQIPIFCWISAELFQETFGGDKKAEIPQTLTEMMAHYLFSQIECRNRKYHEQSEENQEQLLKKHKDFLLKLGKLAFIQLQRNNLIFYDEDFVDCGIDLNEATINSGFCSGVLREEQVFSPKKIFFFVHLTIQEFFAALFVYDCLTNQETEELRDFLNLQDKEHTLVDLLKMTVGKVLEKKNGLLDFFMRFLLGLMVETNRRVLQGLLISPDPNQDTEKKILSHLKAIQRKTMTPDSCISLFQAMVEMRDHKVKDEIQEYLRFPERSKTELAPLHCSALAYMLQVSKKDLEELDLKSYNTTDEGRRRLIPAVTSSRKVILAHCNVTTDWIEPLASVLKYSYSALRDLDLSNNDVEDFGVTMLCDGLSSESCKLKTLRLSGCQITEEGCVFLASALQSNPSHLIELDLSYNNPGESGQEFFSELLNDPKYKLSKLSIDHGGSHRMKPGLRKYACELTWAPNGDYENLIFSEENRKVTWKDNEHLYPHDQRSMDHFIQVRCEQGLHGRCYWEVEVSGPVSVGVVLKEDDKERMDHVWMGNDEKSWCLVCGYDGYYILHNNERVDMPKLGWRSSRVGVYLDWSAGGLSFYRVSSDSLAHLHTFKAAFNKTVHPAVALHPQSSAAFRQLN